MEWDDEGVEDGIDDEVDDGPRMPLLPPEDRLWRHPSEITVSGDAVSRTRTEPRLVTVVALTSCITALITIGLSTVVRPGRPEIAIERVAAPATPATAVAGMADVSPIADGLRSAVVQILADGPKGSTRGSGVIYRSDGLMLTAAHLIEQARSLRVVLDDGRSVGSRLVGADTETDIAVLDLDGGGYPTAALGTTTMLRVGQPTITIGSPTGMSGGPVVSVSVVSALGQQVDMLGNHLVDMVQTDAPIGPGCAGAAVVDTNGVVIGIAAGNVTTDGTLIGYLTPIDVVRVVAAELVNEGHVDHAWLGIEGDTVPAETATGLGVKGAALVRAVQSGSPAASAGISTSDVIVAADGQEVRSMSALIVAVRTRKPGDTLTLSVIHDGEHRSVKVRLAERPSGSSS